MHYNFTITNYSFKTGTRPPWHSPATLKGQFRCGLKPKLFQQAYNLWQTRVVRVYSPDLTLPDTHTHSNQPNTIYLSNTWHQHLHLNDHFSLFSSSTYSSDKCHKLFYWAHAYSVTLRSPNDKCESSDTADLAVLGTHAAEQVDNVSRVKQPLVTGEELKAANWAPQSHLHPPQPEITQSTTKSTSDYSNDSRGHMATDDWCWRLPSNCHNHTCICHSLKSHSNSQPQCQ